MDARSVYVVSSYHRHEHREVIECRGNITPERGENVILRKECHENDGKIDEPCRPDIQIRKRYGETCDIRLMRSCLTLETEVMKGESNTYQNIKNPKALGGDQTTHHQQEIRKNRQTIGSQRNRDIGEIISAGIYDARPLFGMKRVYATQEKHRYKDMAPLVGHDLEERDILMDQMMKDHIDDETQSNPLVKGQLTRNCDVIGEQENAANLPEVDQCKS